MIPCGVVHRFDDNGDEDATMLAIVTPALLGPDISVSLPPLSRPRRARPPDPKEILAVMLRHGLTPAP